MKEIKELNNKYIQINNKYDSMTLRYEIFFFSFTFFTEKHKQKPLFLFFSKIFCDSKQIFNNKKMSINEK